MTSLHRKQKGFTIVELLIVIVVIGILAALVVNTFSGIQQKARNTERQTDIKAIHGQLEAYYAQENVYPTLANLNDDSWVSDNLKGLDLDALQAPGGADNNLAATATENVYGYVPTPEGCDNEDTDCDGYTLTADLEGDDANFVRTSLN